MNRNTLTCLFTCLLIASICGGAQSQQALGAKAKAAGSESQESESVQAEKMVLPEPMGPFKVGVGEFSFIDQSREEVFDPGTKRRLHARLYFPADEVSGLPRLRHTNRENDLISEHFILPTSEEQKLATRGVVSHSYPNAEISSARESYPLLVFSHGGWGFLGSNMVQMEHLASHGYVVVSVTHPYVSSVVMFDDGELVSFDAELQRAFLQTAFSLDYLIQFVSPDPAVRLQAGRDNLSHADYRTSLAPHFLVWRDDMIAGANAIASGEVPDALRSVAEKADLSRLGYFGMSFGAAGVAAAHKDMRALAAINLDGGNWDPALADAEVRVPTLIFHHDPERALQAMPRELFEDLPDATLFPHSEFSYERLKTMGMREDVVRLMVEDADHIDFTDRSLLPRSLRPTGIDGRMLQKIMNDYCLAFFDRYVKGDQDAWPGELVDKYKAVREVDLTYVREWARKRI